MAILSKYILFSILFLSAPTLVAKTDHLRLCTDANAWYPFTFEENGKSRGLHVDIVKLACQKVDLVCEFHSLPWKRCLLSIKSGQMDAVVSASYTKERAQYMSYPRGADIDRKSAFRITQAEYVIATLLESNYEFNGDLSTLPMPILAPLGYSIINNLKEANLQFSEYSKNETMFKILLKTQKGSIVSIVPVPEILESAAMFKDKFKIHAKPITSKSYFVAISNESSLSDTTKFEFWKAIVAIRKDKQRIYQILRKY